MLISVHWAVKNAVTYGIVVCVSFLCDGATASMLPVVTNQVFGVLRGPSVTSYVFSVFGVASLTSALFVKILQTSIGFHGMLLICLSCSITSAVLTYLNEFKKVDYSELARNKGYS